MDQKLKFGIVGTGGRGIFCFAKMIEVRKDLELVALCDPNPVRMREACTVLGRDIPCFDSIAAMTAAKPDGVIITSPDFCHHTNAISALELGMHVFIDKPLATNVTDGRAIMAAAAKAGKHVMIGFNLRHHKVLARLKQMIDDGTLGKVFLAENREFYDGGRSYMARWNGHYSQSGGLWIHKGSHDFDIFNWLLGFPKPLRVSAFAAMNVFTPEGLPFELEDGIKPGPTCNTCHYQTHCKDRYDLGHTASLWSSAASQLDNYTKNQCLYYSGCDTHDNGIAIVEYANGAKISILEDFVCHKNDRVYTIVGDRGMAEVSLENRTIKVTPRWTGDVFTYQLEEDAGGHGGADPGVLESFCQVIRGEATPCSTMEHGLLATALGQAAEISRRQHRMVEMSEIL